ncbi:MAG: phospholipid carrier-dependent glycosyltransferase [Bryobacterales bacterium]|nr:phospholipid carrier-dependent glycosyltransferase [Bryobacterales bacterium]
MIFASLTGAALTILSAWSLGRWLLRRFDLTAALEFASGSALLSAAVFGLLLAHMARPWAMLVLAAMCLAPLALHRSKLSSCGPPAWTWMLPAAYGALYLANALSPEIQSDALNYHLSIPISAVRTGAFPDRITFYDVMPQGLETLFAMAYSAGGDSAAKLVHFSFLAWTVPLLAETALTLGLPAWTGWTGGLFYAITPVAGISGTCAYNDAAITFFTLAVFQLLVLWWRRGDDRLLWPVGICAGFCYAIKFPGALMAPLALAAVLVKRRNRAAARIVLGAMLMAAPWVARAAVLTGNPFAPLLNRFFPNPYFHIDSEEKLSTHLRGYGELDPATIPLELTMYGDLLQGLLGPAWLALPIGLPALRRREGRLLALTGVLAGLPWLLNSGTRFLMPALPFFALAMMMSLPRALSLGLLAAHAITSWPAIIPLYAPQGTWALHGEIPWRAALGLEDRQAFRLRMSVEHNLAQLLEKNTTPLDCILDLVNAPAAITPRALVNAWQSAAGERLVQALETGMNPDRGLFVEWRSRFEERRLRAVRITLESGQAQPAVFQEIELRHNGQPLTPDILWSMQAEPNIWDTPFAVDRNLTSAWSTREPARPGMFYEIDLSAPRTVTEVRIAGHRPAGALRLALSGLEEEWRPLPLPVNPDPQPGLNLRRGAMRYARREGISCVLAATGSDALGRIGQDIQDSPADWDLEPAATYKNVTLYRIRPPAGNAP